MHPRFKAQVDMAINQAGEQCFAIGVQHRCTPGHQYIIVPANLLDAPALNDDSGVAHGILAGAINQCGTKNNSGLGRDVWRRHEAFPFSHRYEASITQSEPLLCSDGQDGHCTGGSTTCETRMSSASGYAATRSSSHTVDLWFC